MKTARPHHPRLHTLMAAAFVVSGTALGPAIAADMPPSLVKMLPTLAEEWGRHPDIIAAVKAQNADALPMIEILQLDDRWQASSGEADFMQPYLANDTVQTLSELAGDAEYVVESFAMDNQGALVGATNKTSDFWQGDEAKFTDSFMDGTGAIHTGDIEYDESADAFLIQISVPVMDGNKAIGAITIGIDLGRWS